MNSLFTITVIVCLVSYIFINWYDQMDLTLGDLLIFSMIALVPFINIIFLLYMIISSLTQYDLSDLPPITLLRGKE